MNNLKPIPEDAIQNVKKVIGALTRPNEIFPITEAQVRCDRAGITGDTFQSVINHLILTKELEVRPMKSHLLRKF